MGNSTASEYINALDLNAANGDTQTKTSGNNYGYGDFTGTDTFTLFADTIYNLTVSQKFSYGIRSNYLKVWIDYNQDLDYEDQGEPYGDKAIKGSFSVPGSASGQTFMRVSLKNGSALGPCEIFSYGEVEDYAVNIRNLTLCHSPISDGNHGDRDCWVVMLDNNEITWQSSWGSQRAD